MSVSKELNDLSMDSKIAVASTTAVTDSVWSQWYEAKKPEDAKKCISPAVVAGSEILGAFSDVKMTSEERGLLEKTETLSEFLALTKRLEEKHQTKRGAAVRDSFAKNMENLQALATAFQPVVDALTSAAPFGAGNMAWGLCSILVTCIAHKYKKEKTIHQFINNISKSLPRLDAYQQLYPTDRMMNLLAKLYAKVVAFLREAYLYYRQTNWKGSFVRFFSAASDALDDGMKPLVTEIDQISRDIREEGIMGLSAELRTTRIAVNEVKKDTNNIKEKAGVISNDLHSVKREVGEHTVEISDVKRKIYDAEETVCKADIDRIKHHFVPISYDPEEIYKAASDQLSSIQRSALQLQACQNIFFDSIFTEWRTPYTPNMASVSEHTNIQHKRIIWLTSSLPSDTTISHVAQQIIDQFRISGNNENASHNSSFIIHSMHQTKIPTTSLPGGKRTPNTLVKEAIYQLLLHYPRLVHTDKTFQNFSLNFTGGSASDLTLKNLGSLLGKLIDSLPTPDIGVINSDELENGKNKISRRQVFWIIDRVDECKFKGPGTSKLREFAEVLEVLVRVPKRGLRVLLTSTYEPSRLETTWAGDDERSQDWGFGKYQV